jgi:hypothetical protein
VSNYAVVVKCSAWFNAEVADSVDYPDRRTDHPRGRYQVLEIATGTFEKAWIRTLIVPANLKSIGARCVMDSGLRNVEFLGSSEVIVLTINYSRRAPFNPFGFAVV